MKRNADFVTLHEVVRDLGSDRYVALSRNRLAVGKGEALFLMLSTGYRDKRGRMRWTEFITVPDSPDARNWLSAAVLRWDVTDRTP